MVLLFQIFFGFFSQLAALFGIENALANAESEGGDFQKLIFLQVFNGFIQAHLHGRGQADFDIFVGLTHVGEVLLFADVNRDIAFAALGFTNYHALVNIHAGAQEEQAALFSVFEAIG